MILISGGSGMMVAIVAAVAGIGAIFAWPALGLTSLTNNSPAVGMITCGAVAYLLSKREYNQLPPRPNTIFFIPVWFLGIIVGGAGIFFLVGMGDLPETPKTPPAAKAKLDRIRKQLSDHASAGSSDLAAAMAKSFRARIVEVTKASGASTVINVYLELDNQDLTKTRSAALYMSVRDLKNYSDEAKKQLCQLALDLLSVKFPKATVHAAAKGWFLWGVQGSKVPGGPAIITLGMDDPLFP